MIADIEPELMGIYNNGVRGGGGSTAAGITVSGTMPSATTTTEGAVQTCNTSTAVTSESVSLVPTQYLFQTEIARLENAIVTAGGTVEPSGGGTQPPITISGATLESAGIVKTCIASNAQVTSETYDVVPTQYFVQSEITRLDNRINTSAGGGGGGGGIQLWTSVTDLGSSATATFEAGKAYKLDVTSGAHQITATTSNGTMVGANSYLTMRMKSRDTLTITPPLIEHDRLHENATNFCTLKFINGGVYMMLDFSVDGYCVSVTNGTLGEDMEGSLYYGIQSSTQTTISFDPATNGTQCDLGGAIADVSKHVVGNGAAATRVSGSATFDAPVSFTSLSLDGAVLTSGTLVLDGANVTNLNNSGAVVFQGTNTVSGTFTHTTGTVMMSSGAHIHGGGVINLGKKTHIGVPAENVDVRITGATITSGSAGNGGVMYISGVNQAAHFEDCLFTGNSAGSGGVCFANYKGGATFTRCTISGNAANKGAGLFGGASCWYECVSCTIKDNTASQGGGICQLDAANGHITFSECVLDGSIQWPGTWSACFRGSNLYSAGNTKLCSNGTAFIEAGGTLNITGNAGDNNGNVISCGSGVIVGSYNGTTWTQGGSATIINSAGEAVTIQGSGTILKKDGTLS